MDAFSEEGEKSPVIPPCTQVYRRWVGRGVKLFRDLEKRKKPWETFFSSLFSDSGSRFQESRICECGGKKGKEFYASISSLYPPLSLLLVWCGIHLDMPVKLNMGKISPCKEVFVLSMPLIVEFSRSMMTADSSSSCWLMAHVLLELPHPPPPPPFP